MIVERVPEEVEQDTLLDQFAEPGSEAEEDLLGAEITEDTLENVGIGDEDASSEAEDADVDASADDAAAEDLPKGEEASEEYNGHCRFCGQGQMVYNFSVMVDGQEALDEVATQKCNCPEAMRYTALLRARKSAEALFGVGSLDLGFSEQIEQATIDMIVECAELVYDERIDKAAIALNDTDKATIKKKDGTIEISRESKTKRTRRA